MMKGWQEVDKSIAGLKDEGAKAVAEAMATMAKNMERMTDTQGKLIDTVTKMQEQIIKLLDAVLDHQKRIEELEREVEGALTAAIEEATEDDRGEEPPPN